MAKGVPSTGRIPLNDVITSFVMVSLLTLTALIYWDGLSGPLLLDDTANLSYHRIYAEGNISLWEIIANSTRQSNLLQGLPRRPLSLLSFGVDVAAHGYSVWHFKLTNLAIHLVTGLLMLWFIGRLLDESDSALRTYRWQIGLAVMALWLLSPLLVSTVLYVIQRMAQLATLFSLAALLSYVIGRQQMRTQFVSGIALVALSYLVFFPLAVASKENAVVFVPLVILTELGFFSTHSRRRELKAVWVFHGLAVILPLLLVARHLTSDGFDPAQLLKDFHHRGFTVWERLLTESRVLVDYLFNLLLPRGYRMGIYWDDFTKSTGFLDPPSTLIAIVFWVVYVAGALALLRTRWKPVAYGLMFFLVAHSLEAGPMPLEFYFEHRNYLPAVGIYLALAVSAALVYARFPNYGKAAAALLVLFVGIFAFATVQRVQTWTSSELIALSAEKAHPGSKRLAVDLATLHAKRGMIDEALEYMDRVDQLNNGPSLATALHRLVLECSVRGKTSEATMEYALATTRAEDIPYTTTAFENLVETGLAYRCDGLDAAGLARHIETIGLDKGLFLHAQRHWLMTVFTGKLYLAGEDGTAAVRLFQEALELDDAKPVPGFLAFQTLLRLERHEEARRLIQRLEELDDGQREAYTRTIDRYSRMLQVSP